MTSTALKTEVNDCFWNSSTVRDGEPCNVPLEGSVLFLNKTKDQDFMLENKYNDDTECKESLVTQDISHQTPHYRVDAKSDQLINHNSLLSSDKYYLIENAFCKDKKINDIYSKWNNLTNKSVCKVCGAQFTRMRRLRDHYTKAHSTERPHSCDQCGAVFALRWDLTLHQRLHARTFHCFLCQKSFPARNKLERHRRTHTGERPFPCTHCDKAFGDKRNLAKHTLTHTGERPYQCDICLKGFRVQSHLKEHHRVHAQSDYYNCTFCDRQFKWKANFSLHVKTHQWSRSQVTN